MTDSGDGYWLTFQVNKRQYKMANYRVTMTSSMGSLDKHSTCQICCGRNKFLNTRHIHLSTTWYNKQMASLGNMSPMCYFCDMAHPIDHMTRQRVILSTSTLSGVHFMEGWGWNGVTPFHCDMETIPGAHITTLKKAWERAYSGNTLPIDTVLAGGLNDIKSMVNWYIRSKEKDMDVIADKVTKQFISDVRGLYSTIKEHSKRHETKDTLAVMTVLHIPAIYWHEWNDGPYPSPDYINMKPVVDKVNLAIEAFNLETGGRAALKLQQSGERGRFRGKSRSFIWEAFREAEKKDMMHLTDNIRCNVVKKVVKHFELGTPKALEIQKT